MIGRSNAAAQLDLPKREVPAPMKLDAGTLGFIIWCGIKRTNQPPTFFGPIAGLGLDGVGRLSSDGCSDRPS